MSFHSLKRGFIAGLALLFSLTALTAYEADDLVVVPALTHRVTDLTGTLSAEQQSSLEAKLAQFEQQKGSQIVILLVPTTGQEDIAQYSIRVVDAWKLGRKGVDDGVLVLVAKDDHKMRIEVGYGLEGAIPDIYAKRIITEDMTPYFKQGDFYGGLSAALDKLISLINGDTLPAPPQQSMNISQWGNLLPLLFFGALIIGAVLRRIFGSFLGGAVNGGLIGGLAWLLGGGLIMVFGAAFAAFIITMMGGLGALNGYGSGMRGGGGFGGGGGGGFSGGGGGFGGGGASGSW